MRSEVSWSEVDYFIRCVLTVLLGVWYYGCFNFMFCNRRVFFVICIYLHFLCSVCVLIFVILCFLCFVVVLCISIFVCTSVGLLPPGESPIAASSSSSSSNNSITWIRSAYNANVQQRYLYNNRKKTSMPFICWTYLTSYFERTNT
jgi:hypothetical protein